MTTMKKFFMYAVWVILFFIFSQVMIYVAINTTYKTKQVDVKTQSIINASVNASSINGTAKCIVKNNTENDIENKYIKIDCYPKNNVLMGTKYIKIDKILTNEEKEFEVRFNYNKVDRAEIEIIDELPNEATNEKKISDPEMTIAMAITALILLFNFA